MCVLVHLGMKWKSKDSKHDPITEARDFMLWVVVLLQTLTQVASAGKDLPEQVRKATDYLGVFQIEFISVHPACFSLVKPFGVEAMIFITALVLAVSVFVLHFGKFAKRKRRGTFTETKRTDRKARHSGRRHLLRQFCFKSLAVIYAPTMNFAFKLVLCQSVETSVLDMETETYVPLTRRVLKTHPHFECNNGPNGPRLAFSSTGASFPVYGLALATLLFVGVVYPVCTFVTLMRMRRRRGVTILSGDQRSMRVWEELVEREWKQDHWCVRVVERAAAAAAAAAAASAAAAATAAAAVDCARPALPRLAHRAPSARVTDC